MDYQKHYDRLVQRSKSRGLDKQALSYYTECHHITPKCMGGSNDKTNLVLLTAGEHYVAHQLLCKIYPDNKSLVFACHMMCQSPNGTDRINNKKYKWFRERFIDAVRSIHTGRKVSEETRQKMSRSAKGRIVKQSTKDKLSKLNKGKTCITDAGRKAISRFHTGRIVTPETKLKQSNTMRAVNITVTCPFCNKQGKLTGMKSWHFEYCKQNPNRVKRNGKL